MVVNWRNHVANKVEVFIASPFVPLSTIKTNSAAHEDLGLLRAFFSRIHPWRCIRFIEEAKTAGTTIKGTRYKRTPPG
jgi:hypothetical protein